VSIDRKYRNCDTALRIACEKGQLKTVEALVQSTEDINVANASGLTPLMTAAYWGHTDIMKLLLQKGADMKKKGPNGISALGNVCQKFVLDAPKAARTAKFLLVNEAPIDAQDDDGNSVSCCREWTP
jgi:ankyrin repeat protein